MTDPSRVDDTDSAHTNPASDTDIAADARSNDAYRADAARRAREFVLESHAETVETVLHCADAVAETWDGDSTTDPQSVAGPLRAGLEAAGAWERLPTILAGAVGATNSSLSATPVAAPPYVVATSRGPMLRATLGGASTRLVVLIQVFDVAGERPTEYVRGATTPVEAVRANFK